MKEYQISKIKEQYPKGTEIELISMEDSQAVPSGTRGIVDFVDDIGTIQVTWNNGSTLGLIVGEDQFKVIKVPTQNFINKGGNDMEQKEFKKVDAPIIGTDGNVFNLIGICSRELKHNGYNKQAEEMIQRIASCHSYEKALCIMTEYVNPVTEDEMEMDDDYDINI